jgi:hypothetical protein
MLTLGIIARWRIACHCQCCTLHISYQAGEVPDPELVRRRIKSIKQFTLFFLGIRVLGEQHKKSNRASETIPSLLPVISRIVSTDEV